MAKTLHVDVDASSIINSVRPDIPPAPIPEPPAALPKEVQQKEKTKETPPPPRTKARVKRNIWNCSSVR